MIHSITWHRSLPNLIYFLTVQFMNAIIRTLSELDTNTTMNAELETVTSSIPFVFQRNHLAAQHYNLYVNSLLRNTRCIFVSAHFVCTLDFFFSSFSQTHQFYFA